MGKTEEQAKMQVIISAGGRFWAFYLAEQLFKRGYLDRLITSYPKFVVTKYGIPRNKTSSIVMKEVLERTWKKLPAFLRDSYNSQFFLCDLFDKSACGKLGRVDIFVGWSSFSLHSLRRAKEKGAVAILERGSSHILYQQNILRQEYERAGFRYKGAHPKVIEKELQEYEEADYISIPSLFAKRSFLEQGVPEDKLIHVPYGVNVSEFSPIPKEDNIFRIIYVGALSLRKGIHYLLQAFSELKLPNSELVLIGSLNGEMKPFLNKYRGSYKWLTPKPQSELYKYYSQGSVFVIPSVEEGLAMVQTQAMACGLPLVCTANSGGEDLIENGREGFIIPIRDVEELKRRILFFYENPKEQKRMAEASSKKAREALSWDDYGERIIGNYKRVLHV